MQPQANSNINNLHNFATSWHTELRRILAAPGEQNPWLPTREAWSLQPRDYQGHLIIYSYLSAYIISMELPPDSTLDYMQLITIHTMTSYLTHYILQWFIPLFLYIIFKPSSGSAPKLRSRLSHLIIYVTTRPPPCLSPTPQSSLKLMSIEAMMPSVAISSSHSFALNLL